MNRLVNEAVRLFVEQKSLDVARDLEATIRSLRAYRRRDSDYEKAIQVWVEGEVTTADPAEGRFVRGPIQREIDRLLDG
jgi:hypothetical protein